MKRFEYIDALRGLAAFYVLIFHVLYVPGPALDLSPKLQPIITMGYSGVVLFYVLSAFTMVNAMQARSGEAERDLKFYVRRVFRIVPLYYFWLAVQLFNLFRAGAGPSSGTIFANVTLSFNFFPGLEKGLVWASWTLGVEMAFYLMFPLIFRVVHSYKSAAVFLLVTICASIAFQYLVHRLPVPEAVVHDFLYFSFFRQLPAFSFGVLAYYIYKAFIEDGKAKILWSFVLLATALLGFGACALWLRELRSGIVDELYIEAFLYTCLLLGLAIRPWRIFVNRLTVFLGIISYSVYLSHPVVIVFLSPVFHQIYSRPLRASAAYAVCALMALALVTVIAYLTYRFLEQPGIRLGNRLSAVISASSRRRATEQS